MKIKILFIIDNFTFGGGAEQQLLYLASGLNKDRFDVSLCNLGSLSQYFFETIKNNNVKLYSIPQKGFFDPICLIRLNRLIGRIKPQIVNTFLFTSDTYGRISGILNAVPIIITSLRNLDLWKKKRHLFIDKLLAKKTTHFTVNAETIKIYLKANLHIPESNITLIYNGVDLLRFRKPSIPLNTYKNLEINNKKIILNIGRFSPQKDHITLIEASRILLRDRNDLVFILVGEGKLKKKILDKIQKQNLKDYFRVLSPTPHIEDLYSISHLVLLTSLYEGCSNFILESMASELPVVATAVGGNPELITDGKTGFLVPPKDPKKIAEKIMFLLDHPEIRLQFGREARKRAEDNFTIERMVRDYEELYINLYNKYLKNNKR